MNREIMLDRLNKAPECIFGMVIGSGVYYKYAIQNKIDFVIAHCGSKFRQMGFPTYAGNLPYSNANKITLDLTIKELLSQNNQLPIVFSITATDPTIDLPTYIEKLRDYGVSGLCNLASLSIHGEDFMKRLKKEGISFDTEVRAIRIAHELGLFTLGAVETPEQCKMMIDAGCDAISVALGMSSGGALGAEQELSLAAAVKKIKSIFKVCDAANRKIYRLFYGGPAKTPALIQYIRNRTNADGFLSGYNIERYFVEEKISGGKLRAAFVSPSLGGIGGLSPNKTYVEQTKDYIEENFRSEIEINQIASDLSISRSYLSDLFSKTEGVSIQQYLIRFRLEQARHLLQDTPISIEDIASLVGYKDYAHFLKSFKKMYGHTASDFRKANIKT